MLQTGGWGRSLYILSKPKALHKTSTFLNFKHEKLPNWQLEPTSKYAIISNLTIWSIFLFKFLYKTSNRVNKITIYWMTPWNKHKAKAHGMIYQYGIEIWNNERDGMRVERDGYTREGENSEMGRNYRLRDPLAWHETGWDDGMMRIVEQANKQGSTIVSRCFVRSINSRKK